MSIFDDMIRYETRMRRIYGAIIFLITFISVLVLNRFFLDIHIIATKIEGCK